MSSIIFLILAIISEVSGTVSLKLAQGLTKLIPSIAMLILYGLSLIFLSLSLKRMEIGVVYAIWSGVGTALIATIGILWFKEPLTAIKIGSLALIIIGVIGLNLNTSY
jgi:small multidrug resistance pump